MPEPILIELSDVTLPSFDESLDRRIAAGRYGYSDHNITVEQFDLTLPAGPRILALAHFNTMLRTDAIKAWTDRNDWDTSPIDDLVAIGGHAQYCYLQCLFPISALGSFIWLNGNRRTPCLSRGISKRDLYLDAYDCLWPERYRFLLARKKVS